MTWSGDIVFLVCLLHISFASEAMRCMNSEEEKKEGEYKENEMKTAVVNGTDSKGQQKLINK